MREYLGPELKIFIGFRNKTLSKYTWTMDERYGICHMNFRWPTVLSHPWGIHFIQVVFGLFFWKLSPFQWWNLHPDFLFFFWLIWELVTRKFYLFHETFFDKFVYYFSIGLRLDIFGHFLIYTKSIHVIFESYVYSLAAFSFMF